MSIRFEQAVKDVRASRVALQADISELRGRLSPPQIAEDALGLIDPDLRLLGRFKERIQHNRLLSLAVLAGVGWLVGARPGTTAAMRSGRGPPAPHHPKQT